MRFVQHMCRLYVISLRFWFKTVLGFLKQILISYHFVLFSTDHGSKWLKPCTSVVYMSAEHMPHNSRIQYPVSFRGCIGEPVWSKYELSWHFHISWSRLLYQLLRVSYAVTSSPYSLSSRAGMRYLPWRRSCTTKLNMLLCTTNSDMLLCTTNLNMLLLYEEIEDFGLRWASTTEIPVRTTLFTLLLPFVQDSAEVCLPKRLKDSMP